MSERNTREERALTGEELGATLLKSVREMKAGRAARRTGPAPNHVVAARLGTGLSQSEFARALPISVRTLQEWEQGRRNPTGAANALIELVLKHPEIVVESLVSRAG